MKYLNWNDEEFYATNSERSEIILSKDIDDVSDLLNYLNDHKKDCHYIWVVNSFDPHGHRIETEYVFYDEAEEAYKYAQKEVFKYIYDDKYAKIDNAGKINQEDVTFGPSSQTLLEFAENALSLDELLDFISKNSRQDRYEKERFDYYYGETYYSTWWDDDEDDDE